MNERTLSPEVVSEYKCMLAEGPVWDEANNTICWVDIVNGRLHEYSVTEKQHKITNINRMIGSFALCDNGNFVAALQDGFAFIERSTGKIIPIIDPEHHLSNNRFNEGKCDPAGRFWAGTMSLSETPNAGNLYMFENKGMPAKKIADVTISNGMAWSADETTFYFIDTPTHAVTAFDFDRKSGHISNRRFIIRIPETEGSPDGMTIDNQGMLWVAHWGGWQVSRYDPNSGEKLLTIKMPVEKVTSCTFGGPSLSDLYITTAKKQLSDEELKNQPLAGSLFVVYNCGFTGLRPVKFKTSQN